MSPIASGKTFVRVLAASVALGALLLFVLTSCIEDNKCMRVSDCASDEVCQAGSCVIAPDGGASSDAPFDAPIDGALDAVADASGDGGDAETGAPDDGASIDGGDAAEVSDGADGDGPLPDAPETAPDADAAPDVTAGG